MKFNIFNLFFAISFFFLAVLATQTAQANKAVLVSYPADTPDTVLWQAKKKIIDMGGIITHEYKIIKYCVPNLPSIGCRC